MNSPAINFQNLRRPVAVASALAFLYASVFVKLGRDWWTDENYSHGLLVPFVIGYIVWLEFGELKKNGGGGSFWAGACLVAAALVLLFAGTLGAELFLQRVSLVVMLAGILVYFWGAKILKSLAAAFALLVLSIPIPQIIFNKIAFPLQIWASQLAISGIRLFEVASVRKGNVIEILPQGSTQTIALEVVEACSGIRSLMTLVTLALVLAYFTRGKKDAFSGGAPKFFDFLKNADFWRAVLLMISAIPIAVLTNAARVTATGVLTYHYGRKALDGFWHDASGWLVYLVALALLLALNAVLKRFKIQGSKLKAQARTSEAERFNFTDESEKAARGAKPAIKNAVLPLLGFLIFGGVFINWFEHRGETAVERKSLREMPEKIGDWRQKGDEIRFDAATESILRTSDYTMREYVSKDNRLANLYVGYYASQRTGATYHSPQNCLPGAGWVMKQPETIEIRTPRGKAFAANKFIIENGVYNEVLIYWYQGRGRTAASEYTDKINTVFDSALRGRSDGAMVRVMTSVGGDEAGATKAAADLSAQIADNLSEFIPD